MIDGKDARYLSSVKDSGLTPHSPQVVAAGSSPNNCYVHGVSQVPKLIQNWGPELGMAVACQCNTLLDRTVRTRLHVPRTASQPLSWPFQRTVPPPLQKTRKPQLGVPSVSTMKDRLELAPRVAPNPADQSFYIRRATEADAAAASSLVTEVRSGERYSVKLAAELGPSLSVGKQSSKNHKPSSHRREVYGTCLLHSQALGTGVGHTL